MVDDRRRPREGSDPHCPAGRDRVGDGELTERGEVGGPDHPGPRVAPVDRHPRGLRGDPHGSAVVHPNVDVVGLPVDRGLVPEVGVVCRPAVIAYPDVRRGPVRHLARLRPGVGRAVPDVEVDTRCRLADGAEAQLQQGRDGEPGDRGEVAVVEGSDVVGGVVVLRVSVALVRTDGHPAARLERHVVAGEDRAQLDRQRRCSPRPPAPSPRRTPPTPRRCRRPRSPCRVPRRRTRRRAARRSCPGSPAGAPGCRPR